jgi:hypothetical protein
MFPPIYPPHDPIITQWVAYIRYGQGDGFKFGVEWGVGGKNAFPGTVKKRVR